MWCWFLSSIDRTPLLGTSRSQQRRPCSKKNTKKLTIFRVQIIHYSLTLILYLIILCYAFMRLLMIRIFSSSIRHHLCVGRIKLRTLVRFRHHFCQSSVASSIFLQCFTYYIYVHMCQFWRQLQLVFELSLLQSVATSSYRLHPEISRMTKILSSKNPLYLHIICKYNDKK